MSDHWGDSAKQALKIMKLSQPEVAKMIGVSQATISRVLNTGRPEELKDKIEDLIHTEHPNSKRAAQITITPRTRKAASTQAANILKRILRKPDAPQPASRASGVTLLALVEQGSIVALCDSLSDLPFALMDVRDPAQPPLKAVIGVCEAHPDTELLKLTTDRADVALFTHTDPVELALDIADAIHPQA